MTSIAADPGDWVSKVATAPDGATVALQPGHYPKAELTGIRKSARAPVVIEGGPGVIFEGERDFNTFGRIAAEVAWWARQHTERGYPGVYPIAHQATLKVTSCTGLAFRKLAFVKSWPTAIYIDSSADLQFEDVKVEGSSYAFYAVGATTKRLLLRRCDWCQDVTRKHLWESVLWVEVHEKYDDRSQYNSNRAYDGSYFLGSGIAGDVEIDDCTIEHAFNGVHLFNKEARPDLSRNIHVHHCRFKRIRDNPIEPENLALNWWVHHNEFEDCYKWFSMEFRAAGWFYVYCNRGWSTELGGPDNEGHTGSEVLKLLPNDSELRPYPGPIHMFNNSWYMFGDIAKKGSIARLAHHNNAVVFCASGPEPKPKDCHRSSVFGDYRKPAPNDPGKELPHFTKNWQSLGISFTNDWVLHHDWLVPLRDYYPSLNGMGEDPRFENPQEGKFKLHAQSRARNRGQPVNVELPGGGSWSPKVPFHVGWWQDDPSVFRDLEYHPLPDNVPNWPGS